MLSPNLLSSLLLVSSSILVSATPAPLKQLVKPKASGRFSMIATSVEDRFSYPPVNAQRGLFFVGNTTQTSCPNVPGVPCPKPGNITVLETTASGYCNLDVLVPGGQQVYVAASGALAYTTAHSNVFPKGANRKSFALDKVSLAYHASPAFHSFTYSGTGKASGWLACPVDPLPSDVLQVFANIELEDSNVPRKNISECIALDFLTTNYTLPGPAAWQYN